MTNSHYKPLEEKPSNCTSFQYRKYERFSMETTRFSYKQILFHIIFISSTFLCLWDRTDSECFGTKSCCIQTKSDYFLQIFDSNFFVYNFCIFITFCYAIVFMNDPKIMRKIQWFLSILAEIGLHHYPTNES